MRVLFCCEINFLGLLLWSSTFNLVHGTMSNVSSSSGNELNWEKLQKAFPIHLTGYGKEGDPVFIFRTGQWDIRGFLESGETAEVVRDFDKYMDRLVNIVTNPELISPRVAGDPPPQKFIIISDMDGYSIRQVAHGLTIQKYVHLMRKFVNALRKKDRNIRKGFFVNSNFVFQSVWNLLKPIFGDLITFLELYGSKSSRWKPAILEYIDKDQLPDYLGGFKDHKPVQIY